MARIGGNLTGILQMKETSKNEIGESVSEWVDHVSHVGFLDLQSGDAKHTSFNAKIQESTHVFLSDWFDVQGCKPENSRFICNGDVYEVMLIDDPVCLHQQIEIYLKYVGVSNE